MVTYSEILNLLLLYIIKAPLWCIDFILIEIRILSFCTTKYNMEKSQQIVPQIGEKRTMEVQDSQILGKLRSKKDWFEYLGQHR